jgi:hypothetical protein
MDNCAVLLTLFLSYQQESLMVDSNKKEPAPPHGGFARYLAWKGRNISQVMAIFLDLVLVLYELPPGLYIAY